MKDEETSNAVITAIGGEIVMRPIFPGGEPVRLSDTQATITAINKQHDEINEKINATLKKTKPIKRKLSAIKNKWGDNLFSMPKVVWDERDKTKKEYDKQWDALIKEFQVYDNSSKEFAQDYHDAVDNCLGMKAVLIQLGYLKGNSFDPCSLRGHLKSAIKKCKAERDAFEDSPPPELHTYVIRCEITNDQLEKMRKDLKQQGFKYDCAKAQSDEAAKAIDKFMDDNKQR